MYNRTTSALTIAAAFLFLVPAQAMGQDGHDMTAATIITSGDLEYSPIEVPGFDSGMQIAAIVGDFSQEGPYSLRLSFPDGYRFPAHFHPMDENITVLEGTLLLAMGDTADESQLVAYRPGDFLVMPAEHPHFGGATGHTVIQLHGVGPFAILLSE